MVKIIIQVSFFSQIWSSLSLLLGWEFVEWIPSKFTICQILVELDYINLLGVNTFRKQQKSFKENHRWFGGLPTLARNFHPSPTYEIFPPPSVSKIEFPNKVGRNWSTSSFVFGGIFWLSEVVRRVGWIINSQKNETKTWHKKQRRVFLCWLY